MSEVTPYQPHDAAVTLTGNAQSLIEWAQSADAAYSLAQKLVTTSFCPQQFRGKPEEAAAAMLSGAEVGLSPMASLRSFDVIQGTAAPRALTLRAVAQSHGHQFQVLEETPQKVVMRGRRHGSETWETVTWDIKRAQQMKLTGKDNWQKQPQAMLVARATSELARRIAADAILGIGHSAEEIADEETPTTTVTRESATKRTVARRKKADPVEAEPAADEPDPPATHEPVDASQWETLPDEPGQDAAPIDEGKRVRGRMFALLTERGITDAEQQRAGMSTILGRQIKSRTELTVDDMRAVIGSLEEQVAGA